MGMKINRILLSAIGGLVLTGAATAAHAELVTYSTTGVFGVPTPGALETGVVSGDGTSSIDVGGGMTITFDGLIGNSVNVPPPSFASLGTFQVAGSGISNIPFFDTFTLTITQSSPSVGTGAFSAVVSGAVSGNASNATSVFFTPFTVTMGDITYSLVSPTLPLVPPSSNNGNTTVEAQITTSVPTPASAVAGSALLGLLAAGKVRSRKNSI
jgi:hypothetical protein